MSLLVDHWQSPRVPFGLTRSLGLVQDGHDYWDDMKSSTPEPELCGLDNISTARNPPLFFCNDYNQLDVLTILHDNYL